jgi:hypothetical protein
MQFRISCLLVSCLLVLSLLPSILLAQEPATVKKQTALSGIVVDTSGAVINGAIVVVRGTDGAEQRKILADSNGAFVISGLAAGSYVLVVSNPGF